MLRPSGQLVLIDFGAVRQITTTILAGNSHTRIISQGYSPPEQQNGYSVQQSDFFALGRTFIFLLTGKEPQDKAIYDPLTNELHWRKYAVNISPLLADLIDNLIAPTANQRPENTRVILQRLQKIEKALNQPYFFGNTTNIQSKSSSLPTVSVSPGKPVQPAAKSSQKNHKTWKWLIGLGVGYFAIAALNQPNNKNIVKYDELTNIIVTAREDGDKLYKAEDLAKSRKVDNLLKAIKLAEAIKPESYLYQKAQELKSGFARKMLKLAQAKMKERDADTAWEIASQIPPIPELQADVDDFIILGEAKRSSFLGTVAGLDTAIAQAQQIDASRDIYNEAQELIARWQLELEDVSRLEKARILASQGTINDSIAAISEVQLIPSNSPRAREARQEIERWRVQVETIEDRPYLERAEQIAVNEDIASLQKAITEASQIPYGRALYPAAQKKIRLWRAKISGDRKGKRTIKAIRKEGELKRALW
jgi:hypothetical protein